MTDRINVIKYFDNDDRFKNLNLNYLKFSVKYYIILDNFMTQKKIPNKFYNLFKECKSYKTIIKMQKDYHISFGVRFIELFLILANIRFLAEPLHFLLATIRLKRLK